MRLCGSCAAAPVPDVYVVCFLALIKVPFLCRPSDTNAQRKSLTTDVFGAAVRSEVMRPSQMPLDFGLGMRTLRHFVWHAPSKIDFSGDELSAAHSVQFVVPEPFAR